MSKYYSGPSDQAGQAWSKLTNEPPSMLACDIETVSLKNRTVLGIGVAAGREDCFYVTADDPEFYKIILLLQDVHITKIWHNAPFDLRVLRSYAPDTWNIS